MTAAMAFGKLADRAAWSLRCEDQIVYSVPENLCMNGLDRIGRPVFCAAMWNPEAVVKAMYDPFVDLEYKVYMMKYDSACGRYSGIAESKEADDVVGSLRHEDRTIYSVSEKLGING